MPPKLGEIFATFMVGFVMPSMRAFLLSLVFTLPFGAAGFAAPVVAEATVDVTQMTEPAARKGTRNYRPDEATTVVPSDTTTAKDSGFSNEEKLTQCMETWDTGTHITKSKWREICQRQLNER